MVEVVGQDYGSGDYGAGEASAPGFVASRFESRETEAVG